LFNGDYELIEDDIPNQWENSLFRFKPSSGTPRTESQLQRDILDIADNIYYSIFSGFTKEDSGLPHARKSKFNYGVADIDITGKSRISLAFESLESLIHGNLSASEIKLEYFRVCVTLLHETAVGFVLFDAYKVL
jgi:hypothetical protein